MGLLAGAPSAELKSNREALYETADFLERELRRAASSAGKAKSGCMSPFKLPQRAASAEEEAAGKSSGGKKTRRGKRRKQKRSAGNADGEVAVNGHGNGDSGAEEAGLSPL